MILRKNRQMGLYGLWRRLVGAPPPGKGYMSTKRARQALDLAKASAAKAGQRAATVAHLGAALVHFNESSAALVLKKLNIELTALSDAIVKDGSNAPLSEILVLADRERRVFGHLSVGTEHLLIALMVHGKNGVARHLVENGVQLVALRELVVKTVDPVFNPDAD
jgi:ATP-dependent Clp protease ATP-binding subunit ClpA